MDEPRPDQQPTAEFLAALEGLKPEEVHVLLKLVAAASQALATSSLENSQPHTIYSNLLKETFEIFGDHDKADSAIEKALETAHAVDRGF